MFPIRSYKDKNKNIHTMNGEKELKEGYFLHSDYELIKYPEHMDNSEDLKNISRRLLRVSDFIRKDKYFAEILPESCEEIEKFIIVEEDFKIKVVAVYPTEEEEISVEIAKGLVGDDKELFINYIEQLLKMMMYFCKSSLKPIEKQ